MAQYLNMKKNIFLGIFLAIVVVFAFWYLQTRKDSQVLVTDFESCVQAGNPVMESYPRQCRTPDGKNFVEPIAVGVPDLASVQENIVVDSPKPGTHVFAALMVIGKARGSWYFEASFPIKLLDSNGNVLARAVAQAQGDWMTAEFVPFSVSLTFTAPVGSALTLVLEKDNPSGLPEHDAQLRIPLIVSRPLY